MALSSSRALALAPPTVSKSEEPKKLLVAPQALEMEEGGIGTTWQDGDMPQSRTDFFHRCFPFNLCGACEALPPLRLATHLVPDTLKVIQDWTHLTCALGIISQVGLIIVSIVSLWENKLSILHPSHLAITTRDILAIFMVVTIFPYCFSVIGRYDGALFDKKEQQRWEKEKLQKEYDNLFTDMNSRIEAFAEYSAGFATSIFEGKMRSLAQWATQSASELDRKTKKMEPQESEEMRDEFISMLMNFARVIQECGIDPVNHPVILYKREELECLTSFKQIAVLVKQRCGTSKTQIETASSSRKVQGWPEQKKGECGTCGQVFSVSASRAAKGKCPTCSGKKMFFPVYLEEIPAWDISKPGQCDQCREWFSPQQALNCNGVCPKCRPERELHEVTQLNEVLKKMQNDNKSNKRKADGLLDRTPSSSHAKGSSDAASKKKCARLCPYIAVGGCQCGRELSSTKDGWPVKCGCLCLAMKIYSKSHINLMVGVLMCIAEFVLYTSWIVHQWVNAAHQDLNKAGYVLLYSAVSFILGNLMILLSRFDEIDFVQQLSREIQNLKAENVKVENTREEIQYTYGQFQDMNEIWLNRTIPRLELVSRTALMLQDMDNPSAGHWMLANKAIQDVEGKIGSLQDWVGNDKVSADDKKAFRRHVEHTYEEDDVNVVAQRLKMLAGGGALGKLEGLRPNEKDRPWHPTMDTDPVSFYAPPVPDFIKRGSEIPMYEP